VCKQHGFDISEEELADILTADDGVESGTEEDPEYEPGADASEASDAPEESDAEESDAEESDAEESDSEYEESEASAESAEDDDEEEAYSPPPAESRKRKRE